MKTTNRETKILNVVQTKVNYVVKDVNMIPFRGQGTIHSFTSEVVRGCCFRYLHCHLDSYT